MWSKPWSMAEGFLIGGGLIVAGLMLEMSVGGVDWNAFAWSLNLITLLTFTLLILGMHLLRGRVYAFRYLSTVQAAVPALLYAVALTTIMGLTRQTVGGVGLNNMLTFWPFVLIYVYIATIVGLVTLRRLGTLIRRKTANIRWSREVLFLLNHLGLFLVMTTATLGNADMQRLKMITAVGETEWRALGEHGKIVELPLAVELKQFIMEQYDDGSPRRFASKVQILTRSGQNISTTVEVNKPVEVEGWRIYQYGYDTQAGPKSKISILELVSGPWLPAVYVGIYMMLAGAVGMFIFGGRRGKQTFESLSEGRQ